jgi:hypothetical protein
VVCDSVYGCFHPNSQNPLDCHGQTSQIQDSLYSAVISFCGWVIVGMQQYPTAGLVMIGIGSLIYFPILISESANEKVEIWFWSIYKEEKPMYRMRTMLFFIFVAGLAITLVSMLFNWDLKHSEPQTSYSASPKGSFFISKKKSPILGLEVSSVSSHNFGRRFLSNFFVDIASRLIVIVVRDEIVIRVRFRQPNRIAGVRYIKLYLEPVSFAEFFQPIFDLQNIQLV